MSVENKCPSSGERNTCNSVQKRWADRRLQNLSDNISKIYACTSSLIKTHIYWHWRCTKDQCAIFGQSQISCLHTDTVFYILFFGFFFCLLGFLISINHWSSVWDYGTAWFSLRRQKKHFLSFKIWDHCFEVNFFFCWRKVK